MRKEYTLHSKEEKLRIVKRYLAGESQKKLHEETGIGDGVYSKVETAVSGRRRGIA